MNNLDLIVLFGTLLFIVAYGVYKTRGQKDIEGGAPQLFQGIETADDLIGRRTAPAPGVCASHEPILELIFAIRRETVARLTER